jgi:hypothetical protein
MYTTRIGFFTRHLLCQLYFKTKNNSEYIVACHQPLGGQIVLNKAMVHYGLFTFTINNEWVVELFIEYLIGTW